MTARDGRIVQNYKDQQSMGYIAAGTETIYALMDEAKHEHMKDKLYDLARKINFKSLISFGVFLSEYKNGKKKLNPDAYYKRFVEKELNYINSKALYEKLYIDSGGFQAANGYLSVDEIDTFHELFRKFITNHKSEFDHTFTLDLPPYRTDMYTSENHCYDLNIKSYRNLFLNLGEEERKHIVMVKHYRTPSLQRIWTKIFSDQELMGKFNSDYWAIAGIVRSSKAEKNIPIVSIVLPMVELLQWAIKNNKKHITIHMLANCAPLQIFLYEAYKKMAKDLYSIKVDITYDSVGSILQIAYGRSVNYIDEYGFNKKVGFGTKDNIVEKQKYLSILNQFLEYYEIDLNFPMDYKLYNDNGSFNTGLYPITILMYIDNFRKLEKLCRDFVNEKMDLYYNNKTIEFTHALRQFIPKLNLAGDSNNILYKIGNMQSTLDFIKYLPINGLKGVDEYINLYMQKDEIKYNTINEIPNYMDI